MLTATIREIISGWEVPGWDTLQSAEDNHLNRYGLYAFRDKDVYLYIGKSGDVDRRVRQHLGLCDSWGNAYPRSMPYSRTAVGNCIYTRIPESLDWEIDFYCNGDFRNPELPEHYWLLEAYSVFAEGILDNPFSELCRLMESECIFRRHPIFNSHHNAGNYPSAVQAQYTQYLPDAREQREISEMLDDLIA